MEVADIALYVANLNEICPIAKTLLIGEVSIYSDGFNETVSRAIGTYAKPSTSKS